MEVDDEKEESIDSVPTFEEILELFLKLDEQKMEEFLDNQELLG